MKSCRQEKGRRTDRLHRGPPSRPAVAMRVAEWREQIAGISA
jgi:hypothetical protein